MKFKSLLLFLALSTPCIAETIESTVPELCDGLEKAFEKRNWGPTICKSVNWKVAGTSVKGRPLMYFEFGAENATNTTLVFSMVHGDEITPLYLGMKLLEWAQENMKDHPGDRLILAPLVNPDGFFGYPKTRMNANGVDCNRNFKTKDWDREALQSWKTKFHSEKRRFPGWKPDSEPETKFQKALIEKFSPQKIISIHSPLNVIDYDGPNSLGLSRFSEDYIKKCIELRSRVRAQSTGFFPGSLGNYAGQELGIPTITLELPTAMAEKAPGYWKAFQKGIVTVINYQVPPKKK